MNSSSPSSEVRRCRPFLGTFVEICASGAGDVLVRDAVDAAFAAIGNVQRRMSAHDPQSELSRLNREAAQRPVAVSAETFSVLGRALELAADSGGAFDPALAPTLARWGLLPKSLAREPSGGWRHVVLLRERRVFFRAPLALDLGGIAKGFAVDAAIEGLRAAGIVSASVNAGGDLRVFGPRPTTVYLRHPAAPQQLARRLRLSDAALATSSPCFSERGRRGRRISHLVNPRDRSAVTGNLSVSVRAPECWVADALTKVVLNAPERAECLLARHHAEAFWLAA